MEGLAGRLKDTSQVPEDEPPIEEDLLDIDNPRNRVWLQMMGVDPRLDHTEPEVEHLNSMGHGLMKFKGTVGTHRTEMASIQSLLDCRASRVFISRSTINRLPTRPTVQKRKHVSVNLPNGEHMTSPGTVNLLRMGSWSGVVKAWVLDTQL